MLHPPSPILDCQSFSGFSSYAPFSKKHVFTLAFVYLLSCLIPIMKILRPIIFFRDEPLNLFIIQLF